MLHAPSTIRNTLRLFACALGLMVPVAPASAVDINLSLNLLYQNPQNAALGGNWQLVVKTDGAGLAGLSALITNITTAQNAAPRGFVNGNNPAGLAFLTNTQNTGYRNLTLGQVPASGAEQSAFYGIGSVPNGMPGSIGPTFTTLTNVMGSPWGPADVLGEMEWNGAALLATGSFAPGTRPDFYANGPDVSFGTTFLSAGSSSAFGPISAPTVADTFVRDNLVQTADYNHNGVVDLADYIVWRNTLGSMTLLDADGDSNGTIENNDYLIWKANFGSVLGTGAATGTVVVPEPAAATLLLLGAAFVLNRGRRAVRRTNRGNSQIRARRFGRGTPSPAGDRCQASGGPICGQIEAWQPANQFIYYGFSGCLSQLLISNEKRLIERGNCLTASKTANIMPKGSRTAGASTSWGHLIGRHDCA